VNRTARFAIALAAELSCFAALNFFDDWTDEAMPVRFVAAGILAGVMFFAAASLFSEIGGRSQRVIFWGAAILLRLIALPLAPGDDLWRYQWEGKIQTAGFNPYVVSPDDPKLEAVRSEAWGKINHRDFSAIYPPGAQLIFRGLASISESPLLYKVVCGGADLAVVALLLRLIRMRSGIENATGSTSKASPYVLASWYAWNPLVVYSFAGAAHFDSTMILPTVAALIFIERSSASADSRQKWLLALGAAVLLGIAISIKLVPAFLLPICAVALGLRAITLLLSAGIPASLCLLYGWPQIPIWESLRRFANVTRLNDLLWWLVEGTFWPNPAQKNYRYNVVLVIAVVLVTILYIRNWRRGMLWVLGTILVLSPVLHPWYCTWILPVATWRRAYAWHVLSVTLFTYFLFWNERLFMLPWHAEPWMRAMIIVPPLVAAVLLIRRRNVEAFVSNP
jgi:hypothetical protein